MVLDPGQIGAFCGVFRIEKRANGALCGLILLWGKWAFDRILVFIRWLSSDSYMHQRMKVFKNYSTDKRSFYIE